MLSTSRDIDALREMDFRVSSQLKLKVLFVCKMEGGPAQTSCNCLEVSSQAKLKTSGRRCAIYLPPSVVHLRSGASKVALELRY
jgi:hypothetical protein